MDEKAGDYDEGYWAGKVDGALSVPRSAAARFAAGYAKGVEDDLAYIGSKHTMHDQLGNVAVCKVLREVFGHFKSRAATSPPTTALAASEVRPKIICLCGSTRFIEMFAIKTWELEREGNIVLGCTLLPMWYCNTPSHFGEATGTKEQCDELHKRKIDLADEVFILNVDSYIGDSTRSEIEYATTLGKPDHIP